MKLFLILSISISILLIIAVLAGLYYAAPYGIVLIDHLPRTMIANLLGNKTTPESFDLKSEVLKVETKDHLILNGWFIPSHEKSNKTIILLHGIRAGKEQMLPKAQLFSEAGFNTVLFDSRAHGESGGKYCTFGYYEKYDISKIIDCIMQKDSTQVIAIYGNSLGGAIALQAMEHDKRIKCGIAESTFASLRETISDYMKQMYIIGPKFLSNISLNRAAELANFNPDDVQPELSAKNINNPVFIGHGDNDINIDYTYGKRIYNNLKSKNKEWHLVKGANHFNVFSYGGNEYQECLISFLHRNLEDK